VTLLPCRAALLAFVLTATHASAQSWPSQPIKLIVPYPAGSLVAVLPGAIVLANATLPSSGNFRPGGTGCSASFVSTVVAACGI
jgi:hypothetical protein